MPAAVHWRDDGGGLSGGFGAQADDRRSAPSPAPASARPRAAAAPPNPARRRRRRPAVHRRLSGRPSALSASSAAISAAVAWHAHAAHLALVFSALASACWRGAELFAIDAFQLAEHAAGVLGLFQRVHRPGKARSGCRAPGRFSARSCRLRDRRAPLRHSGPVRHWRGPANIAPAGCASISASRR